MFRKLKEIGNVRAFEVGSAKLITLDKESKDFILYNVDFKIKSQVKGEFEGILILDNLVLDYSLKGYDFENEKPIRLFEDRHYALHDDKYLITKFADLSHRKVSYYLVDYRASLTREKGVTLPANPIAFIDTNVVCRKKNIFLYDLKSNHCIWEKDIARICSYDIGKGSTLAEIGNVIASDSAVFVLSAFSVLLISVPNGEILWHSKLNTWQSRGITHDKYLYTTSNAYINKIDIGTGEVLYQVGFDYFEIEGKKDLGPISELVWYNNSIWTTMDSAVKTLIEINPEDGSYKNIIPLKDLGITRDCHPPKFYDNRMFLLDFDGTLHVFEME